jgi:hypothetical protein
VVGDQSARLLRVQNAVPRWDIRAPLRHYRGVRLGSTDSAAYVRFVNPTDADTLDELVADCAAMPDSLRAALATERPVPAPRAWQVDEACLAQVRDIDEYV